MLVRLFIILLSLFSVASVAHAELSAKLFADSEGKSVKLYWAVYGWSDDLVGFSVKRKSNSDSSWTNVGDGVIRPETKAGRTYTSQGLTEDQAKELNDAYQAYHEEGKVRPVDADAMREMLTSVGGLQSGDRVKFAKDFNAALIYGFAAIDNTANPDMVYTYGLFPVYEEEHVNKAPLATFKYSPRLRLDDPYRVSLQADDASGVRITWEINEDKYWALSILGYSIYRRPTEPGAEWKTLVKGGYGTSNTEDGVMKFSFFDRDASVEKSYEYGVAPINYFQRRCAMSTVVYAPEVEEELLPIGITSAVQDPSGSVVISWTLNPDEAQTYEGIQVFRSEGIAEDYQAVSSVLKPESQKFIDDSCQFEGEAKEYVYKIRAFGKNGQHVDSKFRNIMVRKLPAPVKGLVGEVFLKNDKPHVKLEWQPADDGVTKNYYVASNVNSEKKLRHGTMGKISTNSVEMPLGGIRGGDVYEFKVIPLSKYGHKGTPAALSMELPMFRYPDISDFKANHRYNMGGAVLSWDFPSLKDLQGFELYMNDELLVRSDVMTAKARGWLIDDLSLREKGDVKFNLVAIGEFTESRAATTYFRPKGDRDYAVPAVELLRAKQLKDDEGNYTNKLQLKWKLPDESNRTEITAFRLYSDVKSEEGDLDFDSSKFISPDTEQVTVDLPEGDRIKYTFRIVPMTSERLKGKYADVTLFKK